METVPQQVSTQSLWCSHNPTTYKSLRHLLCLQKPSAFVCIIYLSKIRLRDLLHLDQDHRGNLLRVEGLNLTLVFNLHFWFGGIIHNFERPVLHVWLDHLVIKLAPNQTLRIWRRIEYNITMQILLNGQDFSGFIVLTEDCVWGVHCHLVLGRISNQSFRVCECHIAWCGPVSLVVGDDLHFTMLEDAHTGVGGAQINANCWPFRHLVTDRSNVKMGERNQIAPDHTSHSFKWIWIVLSSIYYPLKLYQFLDS